LVLQGPVKSPNDKQILDITESLGTFSSTLRDNLRKLSDNEPQINAFVDDFNSLTSLNAIPVLRSGAYWFVMGLHKTGGPQEAHGRPKVPRLQGSQLLDKAFAPGQPQAAANQDGGFIATLNANRVHSGKKVAKGINIHDGRIGKASGKWYRDSEGCLTIHPEDWEVFHTSLPSIAEWKAAPHIGVVRIARQ
jgi:hypothetical protein